MSKNLDYTVLYGKFDRKLIFWYNSETKLNLTGTIFYLLNTKFFLLNSNFFGTIRFLKKSSYYFFRPNRLLTMNSTIFTNMQ